MKSMTPQSIGAMTLKNRFIFPSMCNFYCDAEGFVTEQLKAYVRARVRGGAAAIVMPGSPHGKPGPARPALSDEKYCEGWRELAEVCHAQDCRLILQIHPAKAQAGRDPLLLLPDNMPVEMIREIVASYAACAKRARACGVDGVEIHGAHAHEVAQFMSPYYNHRTDEYGGSTENRARLGCEVVRAIKEAAGEDYPVIFRMSSEELVDGGRTIKESIKVARLLEAAGADALHVSIGMPMSEAYISAPMDVEDGFNLDSIRRIHEAVCIPVIAVNRINTPELAERVIAEGIADFVAVGRAMLADPDFVKKAETGEPIRMCLGCNQGCRKSLTKKAIYCVQNPAAGREAQMEKDSSPLTGKRVLVIGAGVAGLEAALGLSVRGAQVEVWEKEDRAGGLIALACVPPRKQVMERMITYRLEMLSRRKVQLRYHMEADAASVAAYGADLVIIATGSAPSAPDIEGMNDTVAADQALEWIAQGRVDKLGGSAAVLGGGLVGIETADALCAAGIRTEIFEQGEKIGAALNANRRHFISGRLDDAHCVRHCGAQVERVHGGVVAYRHEGERAAAGPFDTVVCALGRRSVNALAQEVARQNAALEVVCLGDAMKPGTAMEAVAQAALFARKWKA